MRISLISGSAIWPLAGQYGIDERDFTSASQVRINADISIQRSNRVRADNATFFDRKNLASAIRFATFRVFASPEAAEVWALDYDEDYPREGTLVMEASFSLDYATTLEISGITAPDLDFDELQNGYPAYADATTWTLTPFGTSDPETGFTLTGWLLTDGTDMWEASNAAERPELVTTWSPIAPATGTPVVTGIYPGRRYLTDAIVAPPERIVSGCTVALSYAVQGGAILDTPA